MVLGSSQLDVRSVALVWHVTLIARLPCRMEVMNSNRHRELEIDLLNYEPAPTETRRCHCGAVLILNYWTFRLDDRKHWDWVFPATPCLLVERPGGLLSEQEEHHEELATLVGQAVLLNKALRSTLLRSIV